MNQKQVLNYDKDIYLLGQILYHVINDGNDIFDTYDIIDSYINLYISIEIHNNITIKTYNNIFMPINRISVQLIWLATYISNTLNNLIVFKDNFHDGKLQIDIAKECKFTPEYILERFYVRF